MRIKTKQEFGVNLGLVGLSWSQNSLREITGQVRTRWVVDLTFGSFGGATLAAHLLDLVFVFPQISDSILNSNPIDYILKIHEYYNMPHTAFMYF